MSKKKKGLIRAILVIFGLTLLIVALSVKFVPEWLSIPGGMALLIGVALNAVLEAGSKIKVWVDLLSPEDEENAPGANDTPPGQEIHQQGETNVVAEQIKADQIGGTRIEYAEHVEFHAAEEKIPPAAPNTALAPVDDFLGRDDELAGLLAQFENGALITGMTGGAGIGKTELARALAQELADDYPDTLEIDLKGADIGQELALTPAQAMRRLLEPFYPGKPLPDEAAALTSLYRDTFAKHKHLILLDNAQDAPQVRPLIPPKPSAVIITSRQNFSLPKFGLRPLRLDVLPMPAARDLLREMAPGLKDAPDENVDTLAERCGRLPLALRVAGSLLNDRPDWDLAHLLTRLENERHRLAALRRPDDPDLDVEAAISISYQALPKDLQEKFAQLGIFPAPFSQEAASAVWNKSENETDQALGTLLTRSLIRYQQESKSYALLDLTRLFALRKLEESERYPDAVQSHAQYYLEMGSAADASYLKGGENIVPALISFGDIWPHLAAAWERITETLKVSEVKTFRVFAEGWLNVFPGKIAYVLDLHLPPREKIPYLQKALKSARLLEDQTAQGNHLSNLGLAYTSLGKVREAISYYEEALEISREIGDRRMAGSVQGNLGSDYYRLGEVREAIMYYTQALGISLEINDQRGKGSNLGNLGNAYADIGEAGKAIEYYTQAMEIARKIGDRRNEGNWLANLGLAYEELGKLQKARQLWRQALDIYEAIEDPRAGKVRGWLEKTEQ